MLDLFLIAILALGFLVLGYFDVNSTKQALKRGTGTEANPVIAWLMKLSPTGWPWIKAGVMLLFVVMVCAGVVLQHLPLRWIVMFLAAADAVYFAVVQMNYSISD